MIDYLNPHHVYIDTQAAPDLSMKVKRDANIMPKIVDTLHNSERIDRAKHTDLISPGMEATRNEPPQTDAEHIVRMYRRGMSHVDIAGKGFELDEVRRVISEATAADETLYPMHRGMQV